MSHHSESNLKLEELQSDKINEVVNLISIAMNPNEARWAENTIKFHFFCKKNNVDDGRKYFVALIDEKIVGMSGLHNYQWGPENITWLGWFAVLPEMQGQKIGYFLMNATIAAAKKFNYRKIFVETYSDDGFERARKFYERYGFKQSGKIDGYINHKTDMVVFSLEL
jgi:GNAT superfamily N-acetyltransferase